MTFYTTVLYFLPNCFVRSTKMPLHPWSTEIFGNILLENFICVNVDNKNYVVLDSDFMSCDVMSIDKNFVTLTWSTSKIKLSRRWYSCGADSLYKFHFYKDLWCKNIFIETSNVREASSKNVAVFFGNFWKKWIFLKKRYGNIETEKYRHGGGD